MERFYYRRLEVYKNVKSLIVQIYELIKVFPKEETYALSDQLRRASVSIASNIAEGFGRYSEKERLYFLGNANGSLMEVSCQLEIAEAVGYIPTETLFELDNNIEIITKQLAGLRRSITNSQHPTPST